MSGPYATSAASYLAGGLKPIPVRGKDVFLKGITGNAGQVTDADVTTWSTVHGTSNVALRLEGAIGIDVDHYDNKHGNDQLLELEGWVGQFLPVTVSSTSRGKGHLARQYFYRTPTDVQFMSQPAQDIEIVQRQHRYSVVAPSIHPSTGEAYAWYGPDGEPLDHVPTLEEFAELPPVWVDFLAVRKGTGSVSGYVEPYAGDIQDYLDTLPSGSEPVPFDTNADRYDSMNVALWKLTELAMMQQEHYDILGAFKAVYEAYTGSTASSTPEEQRSKKVEDSLRGAIAKQEARKEELGLEPYMPFLKSLSQRKAAAEIVVAAEQVLRGEPIAVAAPEELEVLSLSDLLNRPAPAWWVEGLFQESTIGIFAGVTGIGKSFVMLHMAGCVASGADFFGRAVKQGKVLYVVAEGAASFGKRAVAFQDYHGVSIPEGNIGFVESGVNLSDPESLKRIARSLERHQPDLIILDTLSQLAAIENENDAAQLAAVFRTARLMREQRPGSTVIIVHHVNKASGTVRGSSVIKSNVDTVLVAKGSPENFTLSTDFSEDGKQKDGQPITVPGFSLIDHLDTAVVTYSATTGSEDGLWNAVRSFLVGGTRPSAEVKAVVQRAGGYSDRTAGKKLQSYVDDGLLLTEGEGKAKIYSLNSLMR